jgi:hypothetical protein
MKQYFNRIIECGKQAGAYIYMQINNMDFFASDYDQAEMNKLNDCVSLLTSIMDIF